MIFRQKVFLQSARKGVDSYLAGRVYWELQFKFTDLYKYKIQQYKRDHYFVLNHEE